MSRPSADRAGLFIALEGGEGAGKSVQAEALAQRLRDRGCGVALTREPGGTPLGERLRDIILGLSGDAMPPLRPLSEAILFCAARAELVAEVIAPALERGEVVICDRFADSTRAYQGYGRGVEPHVIEKLNEIATGGLRPDLSVLLDLPVAEGLARASAGGALDRFEGENVEFHERVRRGYLSLAEEEPERWLVVDAAQTPDVVTEAIWERVQALLPRPA